MKVDLSESLHNAIADNDNRDHSRVTDRPRRIQIGGTAEGRQDRKAALPGFTEKAKHNRIFGHGFTDGKGGHIGMRLLRVIIVTACYLVLELVVKLVTVAQFIFVIWQKQPHPGMQRLGKMIAKYMHSMWSYCTFASDEAPWPFNPWPRSETEPYR